MMVIKMISYLRKMTLSYTIARNSHKLSGEPSEVNRSFKNLKEKFRNVFARPNNTSKETWERMRKYVMDSNGKTPVIDSLILQFCTWKKHVDVGICYFKFLEDSGYKPGVFIISKYLQLFIMKNGPVTEADKKHILDLYHNLNNQYKSFNLELATTLVKSLCKIDEWEEAVKVTDNFEKDDSGQFCAGYSALIKYFYDHEKEDLGYQYLARILKKGLGPSDHSYEAYFKYCLKDSRTFNEKIEKLFSLWSKYGIKPNKYVTFKCMRICNYQGWSVNVTTVSRSICNVCKQNLSEVYLSDEDYKTLLEVIKQKLIFEEMYSISDPIEIKNFMTFIDSRVPYDIVYDGLNNYYPNRNLMMQQLKLYNTKGKKILIIARKHIKKCFDAMHISNVADCYFLKNWAKDDIFALYAAFSSGRNVKFYSADLLRQHKFAIKDFETDTLFQKWQLLHQYVMDNDKFSTKLSSKVPIDACAQKQQNYWHIPFLSVTHPTRSRHMDKKNWICFRMNS